MVIFLLKIKYITVCLNILTVAGTTESNLLQNQTANKSNPIKHIHVFCSELPQQTSLSDIFTQMSLHAISSNHCAALMPRSRVFRFSKVNIKTINNGFLSVTHQSPLCLYWLCKGAKVINLRHWS